MHHSLKLYGGHRRWTIRLYMFFGAWTKIPLIGRLVRWVANLYGKNMHAAYLLTLREAEELLDIAEGVASARCTCRDVYGKCDNPIDNEILLGPSRHVLLETMPDDSCETEKDKAREVLKDSHRRGLILTILKCRGDFYAICSCCSCCCVPLRLNKKYGIGNVLIRHRDIVEEFRNYQLSYKTRENG